MATSLFALAPSRLPSKLCPLPALKKVSPGKVSTPFCFAVFLSASFTTLTPASPRSLCRVSRMDCTLSHVLQFLVSEENNEECALFGIID